MRVDASTAKDRELRLPCERMKNSLHFYRRLVLQHNDDAHAVQMVMNMNNSFVAST